MVWLGERQLGGRTSEVVLRKGAVRVSLVVWLREKQLGGRTDGVLVMKGADRVSSTIWVGGRGAESDSRTRGTMKLGV